MSESITHKFHKLTCVHTGEGKDPKPKLIVGTFSSTKLRFFSGQKVLLIAEPAVGFRVKGWTGTVNDSSASENNSLIMPEGDWEVGVIYVNTPSKVSHQFPNNALVVQELEPLLKWHPSITPKGVDVDRYEIQLSTVADFSKTVISESLADVYSEEIQFRVVQRLRTGTRYYWRVRAVLKNGIEGPWSKIAIFHSPIRRPALLEPVIDSSLLSQEVTFLWNASPVVRGSVTYVLEYSKSPNFIHTDSIKLFSTRKTVRITGKGKYYWRVKAESTDFGSSDWSQVAVLNLD